jgi:plastocyanin
VVFANQDGVTHTVTSDSGSFDSGNISPRAAVQITFPSAGSYPYHCKIHPSMRGTVNVA